MKALFSEAPLDSGSGKSYSKIAGSKQQINDISERERLCLIFPAASWKYLSRRPTWSRCGRRCWRPLEGTTPYSGKEGEFCSEPELKVEVTCWTKRVEETLTAVKAVHPYEEPVINVIPLYRTGL